MGQEENETKEEMRNLMECSPTLHGRQRADPSDRTRQRDMVGTRFCFDQKSTTSSSWITSLALIVVISIPAAGNHEFMDGNGFRYGQRR
jgi:hypothetical protein